MRPPLVLASSSPYRRELLERLRLPFDVVRPDVDETPFVDETPAGTALRLSRAKAEAVLATRPDAIVIGSDQVAECEGRPIGKPGAHDAAVAQLRGLSGRTAVFHSGLCVAARAPVAPAVQVAVVRTRVRFRPLDHATIETYVALERPYDCAGSARSEALGIVLLEAVFSDDPTALVGLPLIRLVSMLRAIGFPLLPSR